MLDIYSITKNNIYSGNSADYLPKPCVQKSEIPQLQGAWRSNKIIITSRYVSLIGICDTITKWQLCNLYFKLKFSITKYLASSKDDKKKVYDTLQSLGLPSKKVGVL